MTGTSTALGLAAELLGPLARRDEPLGARTTYRVGGRAALYCEVATERDLRRVAEAVRESGVEVLVLGKGSNLLVSDAGFSGLCVTLGGEFGEIEVHPGGARVRAGGAVAYPVLARRLAASGLGGMSWAVGIPGSVGGAVAMNAGGHGAETIDRLVEARIVDLRSTEERVAEVDELALGYRRSNLAATDVVLAADYSVQAADPAALAGEIEEIVAWRREHQPGGRNAGSVFSNPPGDAAGRLLDEAGAKGLRIGSAEVSTKHANFIAADQGGSAEDVRAVLTAARELVRERFGVELATEVRLVGFSR